MSNELPDRLRVHFGLVDNPDEEQIEHWRRTTKNLVAVGFEEEEAARRAAGLAFGDIDRVAYFSAAENIAALLRLAAKR